MGTIHGPFDEGDFRTMQLLKDNIAYYKKQDPAVFGDTVNQYRGNLKEYFQKAA